MCQRIKVQWHPTGRVVQFYYCLIFELVRCTPVTDARGMVTIINLLSGSEAAKFRAASADIMVRFMGGDLTLIAEIQRNAEIQEQLHQTPGQNAFEMFGEAVKHENKKKSIKRSNDLAFEQIIKGMDIEPEERKVVEYLMQQRKKTPFSWSVFHEKHVIYLCLLLIDGQLRVKIGYSADMFDRLITLQAEYKCMVYLCGIGFIKNEQCETDFHYILKKIYPEASFDLTINKTNKEEVYYCTDTIVNEFFSFIKSKEPETSDKSIELLIAQETTKQCELEREKINFEYKSKILEKLEQFPELIRLL